LETRKPEGFRHRHANIVPPSGGSLEIGNSVQVFVNILDPEVPPSGGSLEIGNGNWFSKMALKTDVPPSGGSLEIGNTGLYART